jgi:hypothetical protein
MFVKKDFVKLAILSIAAAALVSSVCFAAEAERPKPAPKPEVVKVQGVVNVTKDANDAIIKVVLVAAEKNYNVVLDVKGLELGAMDGKKVEVEGIVAKKVDELWITVQSFKEVVEAPKAK